MTIDLKTVKHISKLARISLDDEKAKKLAGDLNSIFEFIEKLNKLNTDKIEPLTSIAETTLKLRKDEVKSKNIRDQILKNINIPLCLWDERLSTVGAFNLSSQLDIKVSKKIKNIDQNAAAFILQGAIDYLKINPCVIEG